MDDIMILMNKVIIDILGGFDESQFGIFDDDELIDLQNIWQNEAKGDVMRFIKILSPAQKQRVALWAANRTEYNVGDLVKALQNFTTFLKKSSKSDIYPKPPRIKHGTIFRLKKSQITE